MSSWARSGWASRGKDNRHDREQPYFSHRRADRAAGRPASRANTARAFGAAQGRLAEEPQDVRLSGRGVAGDRGGALQLHRQENARAAGRRERAATATHVAGQHRQQRAGLEEPGSGRTRKRSSRRQWPPLQGRSGAGVCDARAAGRRRGLWPELAQRIHCFLRSRPALRARAARRHASRNLLPSNSRRSSLPRKSASGPTTPDSLPILCTPAAEQPQQPPQAQGQTMPAQYDHTERQAKTSLVTPRGRRRTRGDARRL